MTIQSKIGTSMQAVQHAISESRVARLCVEKGLKMTEPRRVIARVLSDSDDHPDVEALHARVKEHDHSISIATVYRTMKLFEEANIVTKRTSVMAARGMRKFRGTKIITIT